MGDASEHGGGRGGACERCPPTWPTATGPRGGGPTPPSAAWWPTAWPRAGVRVSGPLADPPVEGHLRRRRPGGPGPGRLAAGPGVGAGDVVVLPAAQLGRSRHHLLGRGLPRRGGRSHRPLLRGQGGRVHPPGHRARRGGDRRAVRAQRLPGHLRRAAGRRPAPAWLVVGRHARPTLPGGASPFASMLDDDPIAEPAAVDPDAPALIAFTSGTTRDPKGVVHSHRTIGCETRQLDYMFPRADRPRSPGHRSATSSAWSTPSSCRCCGSGRST